MKAINYFQGLGRNLQNKIVKTHQHLTDNTIEGKHLNADAHLQICQVVKLDTNDTIEMIYSNNGQFINHKNVLVGLSSSYLFKIENQVVTRILISDLNQIEHIHTDIFTEDKIHCQLKNGNSVTVEMFHTKACRLFCQHLTSKINLSTNLKSNPIPIPILRRQTNDVMTYQYSPVILKESVALSLTEHLQCPPNSPNIISNLSPPNIPINSNLN